MSARLTLAAALVGMVLSSSCGQTAYAQEAPENLSCAPLPEYRAALESEHGELPVAIGLVNDKAYAQLFRSTDSGTWTILVVGTNGVACFLTAGSEWDQAAAADLRGSQP